jgi:hypothetical protein
MREELASKYNFDSVDRLTIQEVEEYYEVRQVVNARIIKLSSAVPFLLYESSKMESEDCWTESPILISVKVLHSLETQNLTRNTSLEF